MMKRLLLSIALVAFGSPAAAQLRPGAYTTLRTTDTTANSLIVGGGAGATSGTGGIKAGQISVNGVGIIGTDGRIPAISSTYFASLAGGNITGILEANITDGSLLARVADNETVSGTWTFTSVAGNTFESADPIIRIRETDGPADEKRWRMIATGGDLFFQTSTDADAGHTVIWSVSRTGTTVDSFTIAATKTLLPTGGGCCALSFTGDTDTGIAYNGSGQVIIYTDGTQRGSFTNAGVSLTGAVGTGALTVGAAAGTAAVINRAGGDGTVIDLQASNVSQGSISIAGATTAYNTFMGAHYTQLRPGQGEPDQGLVMVTTGEQIPVKPRRLTKNVRVLNAEGLAIGQETIDVGEAPPDPASERFVFTALSSRRNQRGVYGVWHADLGRTAAGMSWGDPDAEVYQIAALGLTTVWVTDTCGNIEKGMLLSTSPLPGLAERQCAAGMGKGTTIYDPVQRDYTLGKALVDVDWSTVQPDEDGIRKARIPVVLFAG